MTEEELPFKFGIDKDGAYLEIKSGKTTYRLRRKK